MPEAKMTKNITQDGEEFYGICISDLQEAQTFTYVNYTPNDFTSPGKITGVPTKLNENIELANKGTIQFIVYNIDPFDPEFNEKKEILSSFLQGDLYWHFSLYLPACFSASNIYIRTVLQSKIGEIENYDYINYSDYQGYTEKHVTKTEPQTLDLKFYSRQRGIPALIDQRASIITIHYEANEKMLTGFNGVPIIGKEDTIHNITNRDQTFLISVAILSLLVASIIAFTSLLKKDLLNFPLLLIVIGISINMLANLLLLHGSAIPYLLLSLESFSMALISTAALFRTKRKIKKFPMWVLTTIYALVFIGLSVAASIVSTKQAFSLNLCIKIFSVPLGGLIFSKGLFKMIKDKDITEGILWIILAVFTISAPFIDASQMIFTSSISWLLILILLVSIASAFSFFVRLEQQNKYLTTNLQTELLLQTQDLKNIISERDRLLRYLSHDMRKPISSVRRFLLDLKNIEESDSRYKKLEIIENKISNMDRNLEDLQKYSKFTYSSESSTKIFVPDLIKQIFTSLNPDCEANAIHLMINASKVYAYAKKDIVISILNNLVFNAIEHAECKTIEITAAKVKGKCKIIVCDDGKGLDNEEKVFMPYYTESKDVENMGLGLYICQQYIRSMGGSLEYSRENNKTCFTILLPIA